MTVEHVIVCRVIDKQSRSCAEVYDCERTSDSECNVLESRVSLVSLAPITANSRILSVAVRNPFVCRLSSERQW
jgi:hypothetical protein